MLDTQLTQIEADLYDLDETVIMLRNELERTDHPDRQEQMRAEIRAAQVEITRLEAVLQAAGQ
jgi:hypothetical protein